MLVILKKKIEECNDLIDLTGRREYLTAYQQLKVFNAKQTQYTFQYI
jgi:hypothetical protein